MFKDDFFSVIEQAAPEPDVAIFTVRFHPEHTIYQVHFKNNPITPGVLIVQIVKELFSVLKQEKFSIKKIKSVRFTHPIAPTEYPEAQFRLDMQEPDNEELYPVKVTVYSGETVFSKIKLQLKKGTL